MTNSTQGFKDDSQGTVETDPSDDYTYDANGNMIKDENKNITAIDYNHLNLPIRILFGDGNKISYTYNAAGIKQKKVVTTVTSNPNTVSTTEYFNGFQYNNDELQFFPHAEGYVKYNLDDNGVAYFSYVYQYKDHLGNIRLNYAYDKDTDLLKVLDEHHYYPFGLKHKGYNNNIVSEHNWDYQGKENQKELGLNWHDFGARNYDAALGRWMNVDPLTEQYNTWSPYVFSGNRVVDARELEGLEPHSAHKTKQAAAINFGQHYNGRSIINKKEYGTRLYSKTENGNKTYSYVEPNKGSEAGVFIPRIDNLPEGSENEGDAHTHGSDEIEQFAEFGQEDADNKASELDIDETMKDGKTGFVITPNGSVIEIDPETGNTKEISTDVPSDPESPTRKNEIDPSLEPYVPEEKKD